MTDNVRHIKPPTTAASPPFDDPQRTNDLNRRIAINHALDAVRIDIPAGDAERIILLTSLLGDVSDAYRFGHDNITDRYQRLAAAARRILEDDLRNAAR